MTYENNNHPASINKDHSRSNQDGPLGGYAEPSNGGGGGVELDRHGMIGERIDTPFSKLI